MNSTNNAQVKQTFIFILFIGVVGFIIIFGYQAITGMLKQQCTTQRVQFINDLEQYIKEYDEYGSLHREQLNLPCDYTRLCMANSSVYNTKTRENADKGFQSNEANKNNVLMTANTNKKNIFLVGEFVKPVGYSNKTTLTQQYKCFNATAGTVKLTFKGQGRKTLITEQNN